MVDGTSKQVSHQDEAGRGGPAVLYYRASILLNFVVRNKKYLFCWVLWQCLGNQGLNWIYYIGRAMHLYCKIKLKMYWKLNLRTDVGRGGRAALCCHPGPRFNAALFSTLIAPPWRTFNFWPLKEFHQRALHLKEFHKRALQQCRAGAPVWLIGTTFLPGCSSWLMLQLLLSQGSLVIHKTVMRLMFYQCSNDQLCNFGSRV